MALTRIGAQDIVLKLLKTDTNKWYYAAVKDEITLTREPNVAAVLKCDIFRDEITAENGDVVKLILDQQHFQFLGVIKETEKDGPWCHITAYDQIEILNKSECHYTYENLTASQVVLYVAEANHLAIKNPPHVMDSKYQIPARVEDSTWLDVIHKAIELTAENTGLNYYLWDDCGNLCFHSEKWMAEQPHITISEGYLTGYNYGEDASDIFTQATAVEEVNDSNEAEGGRKETITKNDRLEKKYGTINKNIKVEEGENPAQLSQTALEQLQDISIKLSLTGVQGDIVVRGGTPVRVDFFSQDNKEYIRGWFRVKSVTHHLAGGYHSMDLDCELIKMLNDWDDRNPAWDTGKDFPDYE